MAVRFVWGVPVYPVMGMVAAGPHLVCYSRIGLRCLDANSGSTRWELQGDFDDGVATVGSAFAICSTREADDGGDRQPITGIAKIDLETGEIQSLLPVHYSPICSTKRGLLCHRQEGFGGIQTSLAMLKPDTGEVIWEVSATGLAGRFDWDVVCLEDRFVCVRAESVESRSYASGETHWSLPLDRVGGPTTFWSPSVDDETLVFGSAQGSVSIDVLRGTVLWQGLGHYRRSLIQGRLLIADDRTFAIHDPRSGEKLLERELDADRRRLRKGPLRPFASAPALVKGAVLIADQGGGVWGIDERSGDVVSYDRWTKARAIVGPSIAVIGSRMFFTDYSPEEERPSAVVCYSVD